MLLVAQALEFLQQPGVDVFVVGIEMQLRAFLGGRAVVPMFADDSGYRFGFAAGLELEPGVGFGIAIGPILVLVLMLADRPGPRVDFVVGLDYIFPTGLEESLVQVLDPRVIAPMLEDGLGLRVDFVAWLDYELLTGLL